MKLNQLFNLHYGEEKQEIVLENIQKNAEFKGSSLWILACAIFIASIGLNVNSTAVIIGAMLISPLMGPIVGIGFSLATYNIPLFKQSVKNLLVATIVSLLVSTIYFYLSPFKEVQSELLARTTPTIYDVLIAFIGGIVGAISITRVEKGNPIPGVAIATALMPPLCTAGFGIATFSFQFFIGALYLYFINCFFIAIATFLIIKYLKYQSTQTINKQFDKKVRYSISIIMVLLLIPSLFLAYRLIREKAVQDNINQFLKTEFTDKGHTIIYKKINNDSQPKKIELVLLNQNLEPTEIQQLNNRLKNYNIENTELVIKQSSSDLKSEILEEIQLQNKNFSEKDIIIQNLTTELNDYKGNNKELIREMKVLFPEIKKISIGKLNIYEKDTAYTERTVIYTSEKEIDDKTLKRWLQTKLNNNNNNNIKIIKNK